MQNSSSCPAERFFSRAMLWFFVISKAHLCFQPARQGGAAQPGKGPRQGDGPFISVPLLPLVHSSGTETKGPSPCLTQNSRQYFRCYLIRLRALACSGTTHTEIQIIRQCLQPCPDPGNVFRSPSRIHGLLKENSLF